MTQIDDEVPPPGADETPAPPEPQPPAAASSCHQVVPPCPGYHHRDRRRTPRHRLHGRSRSVRQSGSREASHRLSRSPDDDRSISAKLTPGDFELHDIVIQGLRPEDRPFLKARTLTVVTAVVDDRQQGTDHRSHRHERLGDGDRELPRRAPQFPRVKGPPRDPKRPKTKRWFTTTLRQVLASRGQLTYVDHGTPW